MLLVLALGVVPLSAANGIVAVNWCLLCGVVAAVGLQGGNETTRNLGDAGRWLGDADGGEGGGNRRGERRQCARGIQCAHGSGSEKSGSGLNESSVKSDLVRVVVEPNGSVGVVSAREHHVQVRLGVGVLKARSVSLCVVWGFACVWSLAQRAQNGIWMTR